MFRAAGSGPAHIASQPYTLEFSSSISGRAAARRRVCAFWVAGLLLCCLAASPGAIAQSPAPAQEKQTPPAETPKPAEAAQKIPRVTTTVVVHGETPDEYRPEAVTVGNLDGVPLKQMPLSATVVTRELLTDQSARLLSDVVKNDASISNNYVPVGYYGVYEIRGFPIDLATGLEINGMTIAGEQDVPLENKERVEFLKGIAGVESGVASAGGLIDYVTKRPAMVKAVDLATDQRGTAFGAVDLGHLFGSHTQVGVRVNLAGEQIMSYMNDTNGWRAMGSGTADWKITPKALLKGDFEYQHKVERDGSGYQLLGGETVPEINRIYRSTMLGDQPWGPPDTYDTFNTGARFDYDLPHQWKAFAAASYSHSLIQDNVIYAYGCSYEALCQGTGGTAPDYFFAPDGGYDIYDYRDPDELRIDAQAEALVTGHVKTGAVTQDMTFGAELFLRSVQQPGFYTFANPSTTTITDGAVYDYVGSENIYDPITFVPLGTPASLEYPLQTAGPRRLWEDSHQSSAVVQDRIHLPGHIQLLAGGRYDSLRDNNYSLAATSPGTLPTITDKLLWLPQYAVTYNPMKNLTLYSNYGVMLSLGPQAPWWVTNANQFLAPYFTRQAEVGAKYEPDQRILLSTALFHMRAPFFYPQSNGGGFTFVSDGRETHDGIELNAQGKAARWMQLNGSITAMRAISDDSSTPSYNNKQIINMPHLHTTMFADLTLPRLHGLHLMPGWSYTGRKEATRDDAVSVPSYNLFNLGARYTPGCEKGHVTLRLYADNITNKRYWSDTGASYGDTFIWLGAPTTVRFSAHYTF